ncbi:hypothetical protein Dimus_035499 [Dionaea muscipula]
MSNSLYKIDIPYPPLCEGEGEEVAFSIKGKAKELPVRTVLESPPIGKFPIEWRSSCVVERKAYVSGTPDVCLVYDIGLGKWSESPPAPPVFEFNNDCPEVVGNDTHTVYGVPAKLGPFVKEEAREGDKMFSYPLHPSLH